MLEYILILTFQHNKYDLLTNVINSSYSSLADNLIKWLAFKKIKNAFYVTNKKTSW